MITQSVKLNLIPGIVLPRLNAVQYDYGSRVLEFPIWNGEQRFALTGAMTARIQGTKPDRLGFDYAATVDTTNNKIVADLTQQMTVVKGEVICEIVLFKSNERIGTLNFVLDIQPAALNDETSTSQSDLPDIIDLARANMLAAAASATEAKSYAEGGTNTRPGEDTDNAKFYSGQAAGSATAAATSASNAGTDALKAEGHAIGEQNGVPVSSGSPYYENSAKYYKERAAAAAQAAESWSSNPPYIGANGNWWVYNTTTGAFVDSGIDASITVQIADITMLPYNATPYVSNSGTSTDPVFHLYIPRGSSVASCAKTGASGLVDTYTMTFTDGATATFTVTNGRGISSITKTGTVGLVDTYTITYNDGTTTTFNVTNGRDGTGATLASLLDVDLSSLQNGDRLYYDSATGKWKNDQLAAVAKSGSYNDLTNKPTIDTTLDKTSTNAVENKAVATEIELWQALGLSVVSGQVCQTYIQTTP